jgi:hypothetical protein
MRGAPSVVVLLAAPVLVVQGEPPDIGHAEKVGIDLIQVEVTLWPEDGESDRSAGARPGATVVPGRPAGPRRRSGEAAPVA